jgi:hypothetical protein
VVSLRPGGRPDRRPGSRPGRRPGSRRGRRPAKPSRPATAALAAALAIAAFGLAACGGHSPTPGAPQNVGPGHPAAPLATSLSTAGGTWAAVPMGHLDDPPNTFWQLLYRPPDSSSWTNQAKATGVATNGGLVMASPGDRSFAAGVLTSGLLTYSPVIASTDGGRAWTNGLLPRGLAERVDALATNAEGASLALVVGRDGNDVLSTPSGLSTWNPLVTQSSLASSAPGQSCGITSVDAVTFAGGAPVVGASCSRPGVAGVLNYTGGEWHLAGPALSGPFRQEGVTTLALTSAASRIVALLQVTDGAGTALAAGWSGDGARTWIVSPVLPVAASDKIASVGNDATGGVFVLITRPGSSSSLERVAGPGDPWQAMPAPPAGTATVAFGSPDGGSHEGGAQALAVDAATLSVWNLAPGGSAWVKGQVLQVPIQYGSSS